MIKKYIRFYKTNDEYGGFSNFYNSPIKLKGKIWTTVEHYFQAQKFPNTEYEEKIRLTVSPVTAAKMGRDRQLPLRFDWENVKKSIMLEAITAKFTQNPDLKKLLLSTKNLPIIEHTKNDSYWGDGGNGLGKNMLGRLLVEVRNGLVQSSQE
jgi:N-glycosidase YbiA